MQSILSGSAVRTKYMIDDMEEWCRIQGLVRAIRDRFLINGESTQVEISRIKDLLRQIQESLVTIENLIKKSKVSRPKINVKDRVYKEREHLFVLYECLDEIITSSGRLRFQFTVEVTKMRRQMAETLEEASHLGDQISRVYNG